MSENATPNYNNPEFWKWVESHRNDNVSRLLLSANGNVKIDIHAAVIQIECRNRFGRKLGETLAEAPHFYFPSTLAGEQSTSDLLATFHAGLVSRDDCVVDLTAGLGIDSMHIARKARQVTAVERNENLVEAVRYNAEQLGIHNLKAVCGDCRDLLSDLSVNVAFLDPARRATDGSRLFALKECEPDVTEMLADIKSRFDKLILKASPMLDISRSQADLTDVSDIYILGTTTECKELILVCNFRDVVADEPVIHAVTLTTDNEIIDYAFKPSDESDASAQTSNRIPTTDDLLYVPYPATMKAAPVKLLSERFGLQKFHANTHLYFGLSADRKSDFPGEILRIVDVIPWQSKNLKRFKSKYPNVSVSARNFGMTAEQLRAKLGVKEGGSERLRLFGIGLGRDHTDRLLIVTRQF